MARCRTVKVRLSLGRDVFSATPNSTVLAIAKTLDPIHTSGGLLIHPTTTFTDCPALDLFCVPGGLGTDALLSDKATLDFVRAQAGKATWLTSVCTGSLVLGAAGLLKGKRATTHWMSLEHLAEFGATPVKARFVQDGNMMTGGGITAGIDTGLAALAAMDGERVAQAAQLMIEYNPQPPFNAGSPETAPVEIVESLRNSPARAERAKSRAEKVRKAAEAM